MDGWKSRVKDCLQQSNTLFALIFCRGDYQEFSDFYSIFKPAEAEEKAAFLRTGS